MHGFALVILAIFVHELGHLAASRIFGVPLVSFSVKSVGLSMAFDFSRVPYRVEAALHAAGPIFGVLSSVVALMIFKEAAHTFCGISLVLATVNLLPIRGFDGGGILECVLLSICLPHTAERIMHAVSTFFVLILWAAVLWIELRAQANLSYLIFILFFMIKEL